MFLIQLPNIDLFFEEERVKYIFVEEKMVNIVVLTR